jgi:uncharacterized RDD family membrane protein YckC
MSDPSPPPSGQPPATRQAPPGPQPGYAAAGPSGPRANFGQRLIALIVDAIILGIVGAIVQALFAQNLASLIQLLLGLAYYVYLEGSPSGQTVGKKLLNIRVVDFNTGGSIDYGRAAIRYVARYLSGIACGLGYLWMLWDKEKQTWHDKLSTTVVVPTSAYPVSNWPG